MQGPSEELRTAQFKTTISRDLLTLIVGDMLGEGSTRETYVFRPNDQYVIKFETKQQSFQNVAEWEIWSWVKGDSYMEKWFAPCIEISSCGTILLMEKVEPLRAAELPKKLPAFLSDLKPENFGLFQGRVVACDYGTVTSALRTASRKLVAADWRTGSDS